MKKLHNINLYKIYFSKIKHFFLDFFLKLKDAIFNKFNFDFLYNKWILCLYVFIFISFSFTLIFFSYIKIDQSLIANGKLASSGETFYIRHNDSDKLLQTLVEKGDFVKQGDVLFLFDTSSSAISIQLLKDKEKNLNSLKNRLKKELIVLEEVIMNNVKNEKEVKRVIFYAMKKNKIGVHNTKEISKNDKNILEINLNRVSDNFRLYNQDLKNYERVIDLHKNRVFLLDKKIRLLEKDIFVTKKLVIKGLNSEDKLRSLHQKMIDLKIHRHELSLQIENKIAKLNHVKFNQVNYLKNKYEKKLNEHYLVLKELSEINKKIRKINLKIRAATVVSPTSGWIIGVRSTQSNLTIAPGEVLARIISSGNLKAVISVPPHRRNHIQLSQEARIKIIAGHDASNSEYIGKVTYISASTINPKNSTPYYEAHIEIDYESTDFDSTSQDGMPIIASLISNRHSVLSYIFNPVRKILFDSYQ